MEPLTPDVVSSLERAEIDALVDFYRAATPEIVSHTGMGVARAAAAVVMSVPTADVLAMNRALGLGLFDAVDEGTLDEVVATMVATRAPRFFLPVAPVPGHEAIAALLERRGLQPYNNWVRLWRSTADLPAPPDSPLTVRRIDRDHAGVFGDLVAAAFGYPPAVAPLAGLVVGHPNWHHYLAYDADVPIAAAAMYVAGPAAWFGFAATDAAHRRKGAQQALLARRLRDAASLGCARISVETAEDSVVRDAPSFRNVTRAGFLMAYKRPNYLWVRPTNEALGVQPDPTARG